MDRIEFRLVESELPGFDSGETTPAVEVLVNGVPLGSLWQQAGGSDTTPLWVSDAFFSGDWDEDTFDAGPPLWAENVDISQAQQEMYAPIEAGRMAVLTCTCGGFGCGGAAARIDFASDTVTWRDFHEANHGPLVERLGPFTFGLDQYETALTDLTAEVSEAC